MTATLCVDAGTTLIKALVLDGDGTELASAQQPTIVRSPRQGRSEQDMTEVLTAVYGCMRRAAAAVAQPVGAVSITAQGDGAWIVDAAGAPIGPAVLWNDGRAARVVSDWSADGVLERAFRRNGSLGNAGLPSAILAWSLQHSPTTLEEASAVLTCGGWLHLALTGTAGLSPSDASAPWLDARTGTVSRDLIELFGLGDVAHLVPEVLGPDGLTRPLTALAAAETGVPAGIPVTMAPYDVVATAHGSGSVAVGDAFCILGTTLCTGVLLSDPQLDGTPSGLTLLQGDQEPVVRAFPTLAGTGVVDWITKLLGLPGPAALTELARNSRPGAGGVRVWPYLSPAGERAPFLDSAARGVIGGLSFDTTAADLARAVIEGLAHVIRDCLDATGAEPGSLALAGGGAASDLWCQAIADVTGVPTVRSASGQLGAVGALLASQVATGVHGDIAGAAAALRGQRRTFEPDAASRDLFEDRHADFLASRAAVAPRWAAWSTAVDA